jgi:hypothetical protein
MPKQPLFRQFEGIASAGDQNSNFPQVPQGETPAFPKATAYLRGLDNSFSLTVY